MSITKWEPYETRPPRNLGVPESDITKLLTEGE